MRIPMRDKQPNRPKSLRLKISFFVLQLILGNKNRVIRRKILASLYNLGYRSRTLQVLFPTLKPWNTTVSGLFSCLCPCGFSPEENMILQMILGGESYVQNQVQTGRRNKSHNVSALARHGGAFLNHKTLASFRWCKRWFEPIVIWKQFAVQSHKMRGLHHSREPASSAHHHIQHFEFSIDLWQFILQPGILID